MELIIYSLVIIVTLASLLIMIFVLASMLAILFTRVPFVPTPQKNVKLIIDALEIKPGQIFYDLGCGDGRFLIEAEKRGALATGYEVSPWAYLRCRFNLLVHGSKAKLLSYNFFHTNLQDADAVFCFLIDTIMPKLEKKLQADLKPGAKIASYGFHFPNWTPEKVIEIKKNDHRASKLYLYKK